MWHGFVAEKEILMASARHAVRRPCRRPEAVFFRNARRHDAGSWSSGVAYRHAFAAQGKKKRPGPRGVLACARKPGIGSIRRIFSMTLGASIIIPTYRRPDPLQATLADLGRLEVVRGEVLVVDQSPVPCSEGDTLMLPNGMPVRILRRPPGVVAARNFGAAEARHDVLVFLDDDVRIADPKFVHRHLENYDDPAVDAVCGQELNGPDFAAEPPERSQFASLYEAAEFFNRRSSERRDVAHLSTCNCSVRKSSFERVGGFDPIFTGNSYGDDTDLAIRIAQAGMRIVFDPAASVRHLHWQAGGLRLSDSANAASEFDKHFSSWLVYYRHVPPRWRRWFLWHRILRRRLLLRRNVLRLHRWPAILSGIFASRAAARKLIRGAG
jgi:GT2 family glycosyltransferase